MTLQLETIEQKFRGVWKQRLSRSIAMNIRVEIPLKIFNVRLKSK